MDLLNEADIILICADSEVVKCHKNVIQRSSEFFRDIDIPPGGQLCIPHVGASDILLVLEFMYTKEININLADLPRIAELLTFLQINAYIDHVVSIHILSIYLR